MTEPRTLASAYREHHLAALAGPDLFPLPPKPPRNRLWLVVAVIVLLTAAWYVIDSANMAAAPYCSAVVATWDPQRGTREMGPIP